MLNTLRQLESLLIKNGPESDSSARKLSELKCWDTYAEARGLSGWLETDRQTRLPLLSKLLTYPMTIAHFGRTMFPSKEKMQNIMVAGARAEADLPALYWRELSRTLDMPFHIDFVGLQLREKNTPGASFPGVINMTKTKGPLTEIAKDVDGLILFNSGIGHAEESINWNDSLTALRTFNKPILFTSFNEQDLHHDIAFMQREGYKVTRVEPLNPFASEWREEYRNDPIHANHSCFFAESK